jgi:xanthine/uracil permease
MSAGEKECPLKSAQSDSSVASRAIASASPLTTALAGVQWLFFMFANIVVIPISIGQAFHLSPAATTASLERAFILTGIACMLQALVGHRYPFMEGSSGLWWGVILSLAASSAALGQSLADLGGTLAVGILISGLVLILVGATGLGWLLRRLFTPIVTATFYFLLAAQLVGIFFKGMLGLSSNATIQPGIALLSIVLALLVLALTLWGPGLVSNFALLIGIIIGWIAFRLLFPGSVASLAPAGSALFQLFPWGSPSINTGIIAAIILTGLINLSNTYATLAATDALFQKPATSWQYGRSMIVSGFITIAAGLLGIVPYAPYTSSLGLLRATRILDRKPFILGAALFILLGAIPILGQLFASLPISVGDAVLFVAYIQLFGSGLGNIQGMTFTFRTIYRIALPVLLGLALMTLSPIAFSSIPALVRPLLQNGLVMGILLAIIMELIIHSDK